MDEIGFTPMRLPRALDRVEGLFARCRARDVRQVYEERGWLGEVELLEFLTAVLLPEQEVVIRVKGLSVAPAPEMAAEIEALLGSGTMLVEYAGRA